VFDVTLTMIIDCCGGRKGAAVAARFAGWIDTASTSDSHPPCVAWLPVAPGTKVALAASFTFRIATAFIIGFVTGFLSVDPSLGIEIGRTVMLV